VQRELVLGGQPSGKSRCAERRVAAWLTEPAHGVIFLATTLGYGSQPVDADGEQVTLVVAGIEMAVKKSTIAR